MFRFEKKQTNKIKIKQTIMVQWLRQTNDIQKVVGSNSDKAMFMKKYRFKIILNVSRKIVRTCIFYI
jgi:hypothetical protein